VYLLEKALLGGSYPVDDAYLTLHNVAVLYRGGDDANFAGAAPLSGTTSLVHLALVAIAYPLVHVDAAALVSALAIIGYVLGIGRLADRSGVSAVGTGTLVVLALISGLLPLQLLNGLETALALAAITWLLVAASDTRPWPLGLLAGTAPFVRPELAVLAALLLACRARAAVTRSSWHEARLLAVTTLAAATPWTIGNLLGLGSPVTNTLSAKVIWFDEFRMPVAQKIQLLFEGLWFFTAQVGPLVLGAVALVFFPVGRAALVATALFYATVTTLMPSALFQYDGRYQYLLVPILLAGLARALGTAPNRWRQGSVVVTASALLMAVLTAPAHWAYFVRPHDLTRFEYRDIADWSRHNVPNKTPVLVHDPGYLSYWTDIPLVDMVGLKNPVAASLNARFLGQLDPTGRARSIAALARKSEPRFLIVRNDWNRIFRISDSLRNAGWSVILAHDWGFYSGFSLRPPS
jgi:hypothetical protein